MTGAPASPIVVAVVAAYNAPADLPVRCAALAPQVELVIIVDDGSSTVDAADYADNPTRVIPLPRNLGIAGALNAGYRAAREYGATHILVLDQDSQVEDGYVAAGLARFESELAAGVEIVSAVPETVEEERITVRRDGRPFDPIQSGQLMSVDAIDRVGPFADDFVIDSVDSEYTLRARARGFEFTVVPGSRLQHTLGEPTPLLVFGRHLRLLGKPRFSRYHQPFRTYYMVRNGLLLWRRHARGNLRWLLHRPGYMMIDVSFNALSAPDTPAQIRAITRGVRDAIANRAGPIAR
jgi:rhamnosyltransferase